MYKLIFNYAVLLVFTLSCENTGHTANKTPAKLFIHNKKVAAQKNDKEIKYNISNSKGVVVAYVGKDVSKHLSIYNNNGEVWNTIAFEGSLKMNLSKVQPFAKSPDTYLLAFNCIGLIDEYYKVIINENSKETKYIKVQDLSFQLKTWQEYILTCFSIAFNPVNNPIRKNSLDYAKTLAYDKDEFYHPVKFQGDWVQIRWGDETNWHYGWIKWQRGNALIIELFNNA